VPLLVEMDKGGSCPLSVCEGRNWDGRMGGERIRSRYAD
jgi:hypothetical protein